MLKVSIYAGVWVLTILLSVVSVCITTKNNIVTSINDSWHYHRDYRCHRSTGQLGNANYHAPSSKYILQPPKHSSNDTGLLDTSSNGLTKNPINTIKLFVASNNTLPGFLKAHRHPGHLWKRRTLCSLSNQGQYPHRRALSDYNDPVLVNDIEDPDSLKTLVRVKRTEPNLNSPSAYQENYFKNLADSFPQSSYDYIGENDDSDVSIDAKREINSQEYYANDSPVESNSREAEKNSNIELSPRDSDESDGNQLSGDKKSFSAEEVAEDRASSKESIEPVNQRNSGVVLKDPAELVRRKRNNRETAERKQSSEKQDSAKINEEEKLIAEKKQPASSEKLEESDEQCRKPSSLAIADLKADLLRFKRKAKNERREKSFKSKKKKKHASKKHNDPKGNPRRSRKNVRSKNTQRPRSVRKGKNSEARVDGKSHHVGFAKLVSKTNNQNNFRRRSVSPIKPFDIVSENDRTLLRDDTLKNDLVENNINTDNSALFMAEHGGSVQTSKRSESLNTLMQRVEQEIQDGDSIKDETKVRSKRDKSIQSRHGFLSDEDELQYYENIREFQPNTDCAVQDDDSENNEVEVGRAVRSIEEVKDLAKKLVTKVDELENYLNIGEATTDDKEEKRIEIRAIDDLCSNVTATCADFKEPSEIVQRCVPTSTAKIMIDTNIKTKDAHDRVKEKNENSAVKKRSSHENNAKILSRTKNNRRESDKSQRKWGKWTDWSSCSVTCGKGRQIRWRYCLHDCNNAETEMEEKACQLPACPPGKFLGIF